MQCGWGIAAKQTHLNSWNWPSRKATFSVVRELVMFVVIADMQTLNIVSKSLLRYTSICIRLKKTTSWEHQNPLAIVERFFPCLGVSMISFFMAIFQICAIQAVMEPQRITWYWWSSRRTLQATGTDWWMTAQLRLLMTLTEVKTSKPHQIFSRHWMFFSKCHLCNLQTPLVLIVLFVHTATWRGNCTLTPLRGLLSDWQIDNVHPLKNTHTKNWLLLKHVHKETTQRGLGAIPLRHQAACCVVRLQATCNEAVMCGLLCHLCLMTAQRCQCIQTVNWEVKWMWFSWGTQLFVLSFIHSFI